MLKNRYIEILRCMVGLGSLLGVAFLLGGCSGLTQSDSAAISTWWLEPLAEDHSSVSDPSDYDDATSVLISVAVVPGLDTANILNLSPNANLSQYTGARWTDELPELLSSLVGRTLEARAGYQVVSRRNSRDLDRCTLRLELKAFYAELNQAGSTRDVHIAYSGEYRCAGAESRFLKFDSRTPVTADKMGSIVASFQTGLNAALEQLLKQIQ